MKKILLSVTFVVITLLNISAQSNLYSPSNGTFIVLNGGTTTNLDFSWNSSGTGNTFEWYLYSANSFSSAVYSDSSNNMGIDTSIILSYADLNNMLDTLGYNHGDTAMFNWTVKSSSVAGSIWSVDTFSINLVRGYIFESFNPTSPSTGNVVIVDGKHISTVDFTWESAGDTVPEYEFQLDYSFGNFNNPLLSIITTDTSLNVNYDSLNSILVNQGFPLNGTLLGKWRVIAKASGYTKASGTSAISLKRGIIISPFLLTLPLNLNSTIIEGDGNNILKIDWESSGFLAYYKFFIMAPAPSNDTLMIVQTNPNQDSLNLKYEDIDQLLKDNNITIGTTIPLNWSVKAYTPTDSLLSSNSNFIINLTRGKVIKDFIMLNTPNNTSVNFFGYSSKSIDFNWSNAGDSVTYYFEIDSLGKDFSSSLYNSLTANDTFINISYVTIESILESVNIATNSTAELIWRVQATNGPDTVILNSFNLIINRDNLLSPFDLKTPTNNSSFTIQGRSDNEFIADWESSSITSPLYQFVLDTAGGNYSNPLIVLDSDINGTDSTITLKYGAIDAFLEASAIPINGVFGLKWTIRSISQNDTTYANSNNLVSFTRGSVIYPYNLITPSNNNGLVVEGANTDIISFKWKSSNDTLTTYNLHLDSAGASFSSPLLSITGLSDTNSSFTMDQLNQILRANNISNNAFGSFDWYIEAVSGGDILQSSDTFRLHLTRGTVVFPFNQTTPSNGSLLNIAGDGNQTFSIAWDNASPDGNPIYDWVIDLPGNNFSAPILTVVSDNNGADTSITLNYGQVDALLDQAGIAVGDTLISIWSARANAGFTNLLASNKPYFLTLVRGEVIYPFELISPAPSSDVYVSGSSARRLNAEWKNAGGSNISYDFVLDLIGGNFSNPIASYASANGGLDTLLSAGYINFENTLIAQGIQIGDTLKAIWDIKASNAAGFGYSENGPFEINLIRGSVIKPFTLNNPSNNTRVVVQGDATTLVSIDWLSAGNGNYTYKWVIDLPGGDFSPELVDVLSNNMGADNSLDLPFSSIDNLLNSLGLNVGDSIALDWSVRASEGTDQVLSSDIYSIKLVRGGLTVPFGLVGPVDGTIITIPEATAQTLTFSWENADYQGNFNLLDYTWMLDLSTGNFSNPQITRLSDNSGKLNSIVIPFTDIDNLFVQNSIGLDEQLSMKWIVKTGALGSEQFATAQNTVKFIRHEAVGIDELNTSVYSVYPNPSSGSFNIQLTSLISESVEITIVDVIGNKVYSSNRKINNGLNFLLIDNSNLSDGVYFVSVKGNNTVIEERITITK